MLYCVQTYMEKIIPNFKIFILLNFLSFLVFALDSVHFLNFPKKLAFYITKPISFGIYRTSQNISRQFYFIFEARFASQESKALKEQLGQLLSENARLRKNLAETQSLLSQEKHLDPKTYNLLTSRPIGLGRYLKIDKGFESGIKVGEAVVFNENLLGRIINVSQGTSNVQLLADPDSKVAAFSQGSEGRSKGILLGQFGTEIIMDKILHEEKIDAGDLVYSEGTEGFLPRGLILGKVVQVLEQQNEVFKQAKIEPNFDIRDLELVFVITE